MKTKKKRSNKRTHSINIELKNLSPQITLAYMGIHGEVKPTSPFTKLLWNLLSFKIVYLH